jgi:signal transduction histidine kinase
MLMLDASESRKYAGHIGKASQRMLHLINNLVESNRMDSGQLSLTYEGIDVCEMILEILEQYRQRSESRHIRFDVAVPEEQCRVLVDRHAMLEILDNLISNAIKYSPDGTTVTIRVTHAARHVQCAVQDQGQGFAPEDVGALFRKFSRLSAIPARGESSTGLGLFIVKTLVEAMQGNVRAESPGTSQGSIFTVTLPKADDTDE